MEVFVMTWSKADSHLLFWMLVVYFLGLDVEWGPETQSGRRYMAGLMGISVNNLQICLHPIL